MLWRGRQGSSNVEDSRGISRGGLAAGGGIGAVVIAIIYALLGGDPSNAPTELLPGQQQGQAKQYDASQNPADDTLAQFVSVVLKDTEDVWGDLLKNYRKPKLDMFEGQINSACGAASSAVGPFYCPGDEKVYIDLAFF